MFALPQNSPKQRYVCYAAMSRISNTCHAVSVPLQINDDIVLLIYFSVPSIDPLLFIGEIQVETSIRTSGVELFMDNSQSTPWGHRVSISYTCLCNVPQQKLLRVRSVQNRISPFFDMRTQRHPSYGYSSIETNRDCAQCKCSVEDHEWDRQFQRDIHDHIWQCLVYEQFYKCRHIEPWAQSYT